MKAITERQAVLFDLDGTLTDPAEGITRSVQEALRQMGRPVPEQDKLLSFIGPPLLDSFQEYCGMEREEAEKAIRLLGGSLTEIRSCGLTAYGLDHNILIRKKIKDTPPKYPRKAGTPAKEPIQ